MERPTRPSDYTENLDSALDYILDLEQYCRVFETEHEDCSSNIDTIDNLRRIIKEMVSKVPHDKIEGLYKYTGLKERTVHVLAPLEFRINKEHLNLLKLDCFSSKLGINKSVYGLSSMLRVSKLFYSKPSQYDFNTVLLMLYVYPLEYFHPSSIEVLFEGMMTNMARYKLMKKLVDEGYISCNRSKTVKKSIYYCTVKGRKFVLDFIKAYKSITLDTKYYESNYRRTFAETEGPKGKRIGLARQYPALRSESLQGKFKRKKSIEGYSGERKEFESSSSKGRDRKSVV